VPIAKAIAITSATRPAPTPEKNRNCSMRLTVEEIDSIRKATETCFGKASKVFLFGSRVYDHKRGGDIDLYIQPEQQDGLFNRKIQMLTMLFEMIGEQKVDIVVQYSGQKRLIDELALKQGILL
jgi:predicted nucleotidyltransferase